MTKENDKPLRGLTAAEVEERIASGQVNTTSSVKTKSVRQIFFDNICTVFNGVNMLLLLLLIAVGSYKNLLFIGAALINTVIGIVQEIRSKRSVDRLNILTESKLSVLRDGKLTQVSKERLVRGDILLLKRGDQIPADCVVLDGECSVNESLLTGESDLIRKQPGDELLSGSFLVAGSCYCRADRVGSDSYAAKINSAAKKIKKNNSQMMKTFRFIINLCSAIIFPVGAALFLSQHFAHHQPLQSAVISTVSALAGMIPSGMILLTSTVLAVSVIRLSRRKVLVNEMYCIETLARVDVLCLDKTGTLTTEEMRVQDVLPFGANRDEIHTALSSLVAASSDRNATLRAVEDYVAGAAPLPCRRFIPFSSETKWSGGTFQNNKSYFIGAAEFLFSEKEKYAAVFHTIDSLTETVRVLALACSDHPAADGSLPADLRPMALVLVQDQLRDNVHETIDYFKEQGVALKVISGDSVHTVREIAAACGIPGAQNAIDMSTVTTDAELAKAAERCSVFGRVTPEQKKKLILALQAKGHKVAMTGDGVNDVPALKEADCSVAMAAGSEAARNVSQLVLVDNNFSAMPRVVAEGRRTINNIERSSSLYLVKTMYSIILAVYFLFSRHAYPLIPIHLTLIGSLTVGLPSFVLAMQPNKSIVRGNFTFNIITRALPAALCISLNIILAAALSTTLGVTQGELSTIAVYITSLICLLLVVRLSIPLNPLRGAMLCVSTAGLLIAFLFFGGFFNLAPLGATACIVLAISAAVFFLLFNILYNLADRQIEKRRLRSLK